MLKMMTLEEYRDKLIAIFGYEKSLAENITIVADLIIDYYGEEYEAVVVDAIASTKVVLIDQYKRGIRETLQDVIEREEMSESLPENVRLHDIRNLEGIYCEKVILSYSDESYSIDSIKRLAVINSEFLPDSPYFQGKLVGELLKACKAHLSAHSIEGSKLITRNGLAMRVEELSFDGNNVTRKLLSERGYGLETGTNEYARRAIVREIFYPFYDLENDLSTTLIAGNILDSLKLRDMIHEAQMTKDFSSLEAVINSNSDVSYEDVLQSIDEFYDLECSLNGLMSDEERQRVQNQIDEKFVQSITPLCVNIGTNLKVGELKDVITEGKGALS